MWGRGLFERSEFRSPNLRDRGKGTRAPMVLGPFAETKGFRRAGAKPRKILPPPPQPRLIRANRANVPSMYGIMHVYTTTLSDAVPAMAACRV